MLHWYSKGNQRHCSQIKNRGQQLHIFACKGMVGSWIHGSRESNEINFSVVKREFVSLASNFKLQCSTAKKPILCVLCIKSQKLWNNMILYVHQTHKYGHNGLQILSKENPLKGSNKGMWLYFLSFLCFHEWPIKKYTYTEYFSTTKPTTLMEPKPNKQLQAPSMKFKNKISQKRTNSKP